MTARGSSATDPIRAAGSARPRAVGRQRLRTHARPASAALSQALKTSPASRFFSSARTGLRATCSFRYLHGRQSHPSPGGAPCPRKALSSLIATSHRPAPAASPAKIACGRSLHPAPCPAPSPVSPPAPPPAKAPPPRARGSPSVPGCCLLCGKYPSPSALAALLPVTGHAMLNKSCFPLSRWTRALGLPPILRVCMESP